MIDENDSEYLKYQGNQVPRIIRLAWTLFLLFGFIYLVIWAWPDLKVWIQAIK